MGREGGRLAEGEGREGQMRTTWFSIFKGKKFKPECGYLGGRTRHLQRDGIPGGETQTADRRDCPERRVEGSWWSSWYILVTRMRK